MLRFGRVLQQPGVCYLRDVTGIAADTTIGRQGPAEAVFQVPRNRAEAVDSERLTLSPFAVGGEHAHLLPEAGCGHATLEFFPLRQAQVHRAIGVVAGE